LQGIYTLTGLPALAVPCGMVEGLPIGVQLVGAPGCETTVIAATRTMQRKH
jgi:Asp-tRNA(Asn)/Glu-tRNA(Gln) amidotransferase A subunit family amidase